MDNIETVTTGVSSEGALSVRDAARMLANERVKKTKEEAPAETPEVEAPPAVEDSEPAQAETEPGPVEATGETETPEPELPAIEAPKSWAKEERERFATLPRETQEYLAQRESERERAFTKSQQEVAEQKKAYEAYSARAEQARQQYEQTLPQLVQQLNSQIMGEFSDLTSWEAVEKLAAEDPFRYQRFQVAVEKSKMANQELIQAHQRRQQEMSEMWKEFKRKEDAAFAAAVPEWSDEKRRKSLQDGARKTLSDVGFTEQELAPVLNGQSGVSFQDHRVQLLLLDAYRWREAQAKAKEVKKAQLPPVQRPGTARPAGAAAAERVQKLQSNLEHLTGAAALRAAVELQKAKRAAAGH